MFCLHYKSSFLKFLTLILFTPNYDLMDRIGLMYIVRILQVVYLDKTLLVFTNYVII